MDEIQCVNLILDKSKQVLNKDTYAVKSWLIVGKTLFPKNFKILYELYLIEKSNENISEIVKLIHNLYLNFSSEPIFKKDLQNITISLFNSETNEESIKYRNIFSMLPNNMQCNLLLDLIEAYYKNPIEQCKVLKFLLEKHQDYVPARVQLANLIKINLMVEKNSEFKTLSNGRCHYLVFEVLPFLLSCPQLYNINEQEILNLFYLVIEYFLNRIFIYSEHELSIWKTFSSIVHLFGTQLRWRTNELLDAAKNKEEKIECLEGLLSSLSTINRDAYDVSKQKLFFHTIELYIEALYNHMVELGYNIVTKQQSSLLLEFSSNEAFQTEKFNNKNKRMKLAGDEPILIASKLNFLIAIKCWKILKSQYLIKDFDSLVSNLSSNFLLSIFHILEIDVFLYEGLFSEALHAIEFSLRSFGNFIDIKLVLQKVYCLFRLKQYKDSIENLFQCFQSDLIVPSSITSDLKLSLFEKKRILKYVHINSPDLFVFSIRVILSMLRMRITGIGIPTSDTVLGHMIVLLQFDWPINVSLFEEILLIIKQNHSFCYPIFIDYIINVEIIEEFAFLLNSNSVKLELCCTGARNQNCRSMERLLKKTGQKENLKMILEKQVSRSNEELCDVIKQFLAKEQDSIKKCCEN